MDGSLAHYMEVNTSSPGKKWGKEGRREGGGREADMKREGIMQRKKREEWREGGRERLFRKMCSDKWCIACSKCSF